MSKGKNTEKNAKAKELARLILESKEFSKKHTEIKKYFNKIEKYLEELKQKEQPQNHIPLFAFKTSKLGMLETAVKYLVEENGLRIEQIARLLNRSYTTIHSTYRKTKQKHPEKFSEKKEFSGKKGILIDATIFSDRSKSPLHSIIAFLKDERQMTFTQIARALSRDVRNISATYYKYKRSANE